MSDILDDKDRWEAAEDALDDIGMTPRLVLWMVEENLIKRLHALHYRKIDCSGDAQAYAYIQGMVEELDASLGKIRKVNHEIYGSMLSEDHWKEQHAEPS